MIKFPGGVRKIFYIDDQQAVEANTDDLKTVYLSSLIRSWNLKNVNNNSIYLEEISNIDSFNYMIECVHFLVKGKIIYKLIRKCWIQI